MKRALAVALALPALLLAAEKKAPRGAAENEAVSLSATILNPEQIRAAVGSDFHGSFTVMEVRLLPKAGKPVVVRFDDFVLRSQSDGDHSGPLAAAQIADGGALVVRQTFVPRSGPDAPAIVAESNVEMKNGETKATQLEALKKRILVEGTTAEPETGLLFFPLEREKPKNLALIYSTPQGKLRLEFKSK